ncbi:cytidine deaminase [Penaeicola halotolerans]|uniref:cytidine deaminase n=1 Tax=Penaeicola halotolerans TaxID=2793196 RepID=UPI001CF8D2BC|nr:cytidine deaminase [Penaeicola halotolerans]
MSRKVEKIISLEEYQYAELTLADQELIREAKVAANNAHAPYSQFKVGAALRLKDGRIVKANNQENASYPVGICAERVALAYAFANDSKAVVSAIAVVARKQDAPETVPVTPCGMCRQAISEYETKQSSPIRILMEAPEGRVYVSANIDNLLPFKFSDNDLK